jgi:hypothetical protein
MKTGSMWNINDFPTYQMVYGWSTHEKLACLYYMKINKVFTLTNDSKMSFFLLSTTTLANKSQVQKEIRRTSLKGMLHNRFFLVMNCMT